MSINIIKAVGDPKLFRRFLADKNDSLASWQNWNTVLRATYGLPIKQKHADLVLKCTGRSIESLPTNGFDTALYLVGRRGGKSRIAAIIGAWEACLSGKWELLSPGEIGLVAIIAPSRKQARIVKHYLRAIFLTPLLADEVVHETAEGFELASGVVIEILVADYRSVRGYTLLAAIVDEVCFMGLAEESKVRSDTELIRAIKPSLATLNGRLIAISSKYAKKGWAYWSSKKNFANNKSNILVWEAESRTMNPILSQEIVDAALLDDRASALSEYLNLWREDISQWLPPEVISQVVHEGRRELVPRSYHKYFGFVDVSGGRSESSALSIAHQNEKKVVVIDYLKEYKSPHNPLECIGDMARQLKKFAIRKVTGDNYSGEFCVQQFCNHGILFDKCKLPKSALYLEAISMICSRTVEILDDEVLIRQLCGLERKTRSGGKDSVDHPAGGKDDVANSVVGVMYCTAKRKRRVGGLFLAPTPEFEAMASVMSI